MAKTRAKDAICIVMPGLLPTWLKREQKTQSALLFLCCNKVNNQNTVLDIGLYGINNFLYYNWYFGALADLSSFCTVTHWTYESRQLDYTAKI
jgi:hypothetical protein